MGGNLLLPGEISQCKHDCGSPNQVQFVCRVSQISATNHSFFSKSPNFVQRDTRPVMRVSPFRLWLKLKRANMRAKVRTSVRVRVAARPVTTVANAKTRARAVA